ncbi:hypothetical protein F5Y03DRAFT_404651 [Xylaria venustula]|nr:hypothetical protein F5Y03DRAFT_404651 [Xylaria venustula]
MDYVVLEQRDDLMPELGCMVALMPNTFRVLDQLNILEATLSVMSRLDDNVFISALDGSIWKEERLGPRIETYLPESAKPRIHTRKRVVHIDMAEDGVHSRTRQAMQSLAVGEPVNTEQPSPYTTTYRLLFGRVALLPGISPHTDYEAGTRQACFGVYEKIEMPAARWTDDDERAILEKWGKLYMAPGVTLEKVYQSRNGSVKAISLEEGLLDTRWWKRIVLVGDSVRKLEPHEGLGYNSGLSDLVDLINRLRRLTGANTASPVVTADLESVFRAYQTQCMKDMPTIIDIFLWPYLPLSTYGIKYIFGPIMSRAPILEWPPERCLPVGAIPCASSDS